jgi:hypothetical protein
MATVIEADDLNRYEVVEVRNWGTRPLNVSLSQSTASGTTSTAVDAFGRQRVSTPLTLFDSSHRYKDNGLWETQTASGGAAVFSANEGLVNLNVTTTSGSKVIRETTKVFSYQPGKSLLVLNTFTFNAPKVNLRQRCGYYGADNGIYFQVDGTGASSVSFVERSLVTGAVTESVITQSNWNVDKLDGTGPSKLTLDVSKSQILWMDIEWLGLGTVRVGFIINGQFIHCHSFNHANLITGTYITTASLPLRYEIENTGTTTTSSTLKQVCSTVISEGGYELRGLQQSIETPIGSPRDLTTVNTYYPIISLRLKTSPNFLDGIVILTALSIMGISNNANYNWQVIASTTTTGGTWVSAGVNSAVEYNRTGASLAGGRILASGFTNGSNQGSQAVDILKEALFSFQLERNGLTGTSYEITLAVASDVAGADIYASMDWEEISR